jgi:hypothetical protein
MDTLSDSPDVWINECVSDKPAVSREGVCGVEDYGEGTSSDVCAKNIDGTGDRRNLTNTRKRDLEVSWPPIGNQILTRSEW